MPARFKLWGFLVVIVLIVFGIFNFNRDRSGGPLPISLQYVGNGNFPNGASVRSGPTFSITNHTSKALLITASVEVRLGTNWVYDPSFPNLQHIPLAANTGIYATIDFEYVRYGRAGPTWVGSDSKDYPTNTWRLEIATSEALAGPSRVFEALKWFSHSLFKSSKLTRIPMRSLLAANRTWYGNHQSFESEEVLDPKSRQ